MKYLKCEWIHNFIDEPSLFYSELDDARYETRKIEIYKDGRIGYAYDDIEFGGSRLSECAVPVIEEINKDPEFVACEMTADEFNAVWEEITNKF